MIDLIPFIKGDCQDWIHKHYSTEKQACINELQGYTQEQKDTMWQFINACRARSNYFESLYNNGNLDVSQINYKDILPGA